VEAVHQKKRFVLDELVIPGRWDVSRRHTDRLIREEGLDDLEMLLTPREWDEVPFVSRLDRIAFLSGMDSTEKSRVLVVNAVKYLDRIVRIF
jgi:hypothetical protein